MGQVEGRGVCKHAKWRRVVVRGGWGLGPMTTQHRNTSTATALIIAGSKNTSVVVRKLEMS